MLVHGRRGWAFRTLKSKTHPLWQDALSITLDIEKGRVEGFDWSSFVASKKFEDVFTFYVFRFFCLEAI